MKTTKMSMPNVMLRLEGTAVLVASVIAYGYLGYSWWVFALLLLWPDLAFIAYAVDKRFGSVVYNVVHSYPLPLMLTGASILFAWSFGLQFALIWLAHIGMDRTMGYGLKYAGEFKMTHMSNI
jgi:multisubunit Na+/H+ antiporter MnhB subunit